MRHLLVAAALLGLTGSARADYMVSINSTVTTPAGTGTSETTTGANGSSLTLARFNDQPGNAELGTAAAPIHLTFGTTATTPSSGGVDSYNLPFTFTLVFSGATGSATATASGNYSGRLSSNASTLMGTYTGGTLNTTSYTALALGSTTIFVKLDAITPPGTPPDSKNDFSVSVYEAPAVPEPSSLALCGVAGVIGLAARTRQRRRAIG